MMRCRRLLIFFSAATLFAADSSLSTPGLDQLSPQKFDRLLRQGLNADTANRTRKLTLARDWTTEVAVKEECAIPLLEYRVKHPERFTMRSLRVKGSMDTIGFPAMPVCK